MQMMSERSEGVAVKDDIRRTTDDDRNYCEYCIALTKTERVVH